MVPSDDSGPFWSKGLLDQVAAAEAVGTSITVAFLVLTALGMVRQFSSAPTGRHPFLTQLSRPHRSSYDQQPGPAPRNPGGGRRVFLVAGSLAVLLGFLGFHLTGPVAGAAAAVGGAWLPFARDRRGTQKRRERLDEQFAEYVEATAMAVRGGLSIRQAMEFAAEESEEPLPALLHGILSDHRLGSSFDQVLDRLAEEVPTSEARLLTLVLRLHARSGGNLADSLDGVVSSIRDRTAARRELHVLSAQGRMSGAILALLPLVFFVVLAAASRSDMSPALRSPAGITLVSSGLALQGLGYVWIKRLLRVRL